ncbi:formyltransferase family protein [Streptomyces melanogenes]|uniref:formyltransferase family protein n=1 Tax=Streptomyces melanogenes TaxID=67326 RepID=UPI00378B911C
MAIAQSSSVLGRPAGIGELAGMPEVDDVLAALWLNELLPNEVLFPSLARHPEATGPMAAPQRLASMYGAAVRTVTDINTGTDHAWATAFAPHVLISLGFGQILRPHVIELPPLGCFNTHPGDLPRYAGLFCPVRAILAGEENLVCTLHRMDRGIDTGPIVSQAHIPVDRAQSVTWHYEQLYLAGTPLVHELLSSLSAGRPAREQPQARGTRSYGGCLDLNEVTALHARGMRLAQRRDFRHYLGAFIASEPGRTDGLHAELTRCWQAWLSTLAPPARSLLDRVITLEELLLRGRIPAPAPNGSELAVEEVS